MCPKHVGPWVQILVQLLKKIGADLFPACNPSTWEATEQRLLRFEASLGPSVRPCLEDKNPEPITAPPWYFTRCIESRQIFTLGKEKKEEERKTRHFYTVCILESRELKICMYVTACLIHLENGVVELLYYNHSSNVFISITVQLITVTRDYWLHVRMLLKVVRYGNQELPYKFWCVSSSSKLECVQHT